MTKPLRIALLLLLVCSALSAQELTVMDELGSPVRDVYFVNKDTSTFSFTDKNGSVNLRYFLNTDMITISHSGFLTISKKKEELFVQGNKLILMFEGIL